MKIQNITPEQITSELFNIFSDDRRESQYMNERGEMYAGLIGWAGVMSPENRPAFIKTFGAAVVLECEQAARARVDEYRAAVDRSTYHRNEMAADAFEASGEVPAVGSFAWRPVLSSRRTRPNFHPLRMSTHGAKVWKTDTGTRSRFGRN